MDREQLIRASFDASSDVVWAESLLPKFKLYQVEGAELNNYREAWNRYTEARDWEWWKEHAKKISTEELRDELAADIQKLDALGVEQWWKRKGAHDTNKVQEILDSVKNSNPQEQTRTQETGRKR